MALIQSSLLELVRSASNEEKEAIFNELARELANFDESPIVGVPFHVTDERDRTVGYYYAVDPDAYAQCPPMSSNEAIDAMRRSDALDRDAIPAEQMIAELMETSCPSSQAQ